MRICHLNFRLKNISGYFLWSFISFRTTMSEFVNTSLNRSSLMNVYFIYFIVDHRINPYNKHLISVNIIISWFDSNLDTRMKWNNFLVMIFCRKLTVCTIKLNRAKHDSMTSPVMFYTTLTLPPPPHHPPMSRFLWSPP